MAIRWTSKRRKKLSEYEQKVKSLGYANFDDFIGGKGFSLTIAEQSKLLNVNPMNFFKFHKFYRQKRFEEDQRGVGDQCK